LLIVLPAQKRLRVVAPADAVVYEDLGNGWIASLPEIGMPSEAGMPREGEAACFYYLEGTLTIGSGNTLMKCAPSTESIFQSLVAEFMREGKYNNQHTAFTVLGRSPTL
jgi:hypothetical protein